MTAADGSDAPVEAVDVRDPDVVADVLTRGKLELEGRLLAASNATFVGSAELDGVAIGCVYKPIAGERPLWDFPDGSLAARERAAYIVSEAGGWHAVPTTVLRDGPLGHGMVQRWVDVDPDVMLVDVVSPDEVEADWLVILEAEDRLGEPVLLVHADDARLRSLAVLDAVLNNADRKGGHVLLGESGALFGCDHGVTFHEEPKLRTVLWGWAGRPLRDGDRERLASLQTALDGPAGGELATLLSGTEVKALHERVRGLMAAGAMPLPESSWRVIPWPPL